jgi:RNA polymerase sigma-70 factor (ECF subfamily)
MTARPDLDRLLAHDRYVRALAKRLVFDGHAGEDLAQDAWLAALENGPRDLRSPRAWLAVLVRNAARDRGRRDERRKARERAASRPDGVPSAEEVQRLEEQRRCLVAAVLALGEPYRQTMLCACFPPRPPREVARMLGVPVETVRTRIRRAHAELRARLDDENGGAPGAHALALVRGLKLEPPSVGVAVASALTEGLTMAVLKKAALIGGGALLLALPFVLRDAVAPAPPAVPSAVSPADEFGLRASPGDVAPRGAGLVPERAEPARVAVPVPAEPAAEAPTLGALRVHVVWGEDGTPAAGIWAHVSLGGRADAGTDTRLERTGADGSFLLERLEPGSARVQLVHGARAQTDVAPGATADVEIVIPPGFDVHGLVTDAAERPVAGAEIVLESAAAPRWVRPTLTVTDREGRFALRAIRSNFLPAVSARASGFAPTARAILMSTEGVDVEVHLRFPAAGGALAGRVFGPDGEPVAGATVVVGDEDERGRLTLPDGARAWSWAREVVVCDERGGFRFPGLPAGRHELQARARGLAPWRGEAEIFAGRTAEAFVTLSAPATLIGRVVDPAGQPVAGASVDAGGAFRFAGAWTRSDDDGRFELRDLPVGPFEAHAEHGGQARASFVGAAGAVLEWRAVLSAGPPLLGRVAAPGADLAGLLVIGYGSDGTMLGPTRTDAEGRFRFDSCAEGEYSLELSRDGGGVLAHAAGARPGAEEFVLALDPALLAEPSVMLRGRVVDSAGAPVGGAHAIPRGPATIPTVALADAKTGRFELGPLVPGEWSVVARARGRADAETARVTLGPGASHDFGDVVLFRGGTLRVSLGRAAGAPAVEPVLVVASGGGSAMRLEVAGEEALSGPLAAGDYVLRVVATPGCPFAASEWPFSIADGRETRLIVELRPATAAQGMDAEAPDSGRGSPARATTRGLEPRGGV